MIGSYGKILLQCCFVEVVYVVEQVQFEFGYVDIGGELFGDVGVGVLVLYLVGDGYVGYVVGVLYVVLVVCVFNVEYGYVQVLVVLQ